MKALNEKKGVWFIYDGECPICKQAAKALRIKKTFGTLSTLDARAHTDDPLIDAINHKNLDLDEGMVIYVDGQFFHGKEALQFMAKYGEAHNIFMATLRSLFWSKILSRLMYPWMRATRNYLLRRKKVKRIDNLQLKNEPIFKSIFGEQWASLPPVMKKHYSNRPYTQDISTVTGHLDVSCKPPLLWLSPLMKLLGQIPTHNEKNVPVTVHFESDLNSKSFHFNRMFTFTKSAPYAFQSRMLQVKDNEVIEIMKFGLGWKMLYNWDGEKVILTHKGYALNFFGHFIPLPLTIIMGKGYAEERPLTEHSFEMETHIHHPWWGKLYEYKGHFEVSHSCTF